MKDTLKFFFFVLTGALCLMVDSFLNGFPIVYSDTSTFLASGFQLETPFDRPITYGLFIRLFSLNGLSLWFVVFFQALLVSYLVFLFVKLIVGEQIYLKSGLIIIVFLSIFTGLSWTVCQLIPDIFTSVAFLSLILILFGKFKKAILVFLYIVFFLSVAMHMSHILLFSIIIFLIFVSRDYLLHKEKYPQKNIQLLSLFVLTLASIVTMGSALSKSKHVFFMGAMVEHGILKQYLDDNCSSKQYKLCAYKDSLPDRAYKFIWEEKTSPFYKIGGWKESKTEFNEIINATLTQPKYIKMHIVESAKATFEQLTRFGIGDGNGSFLEGTLLYERLAKYVKNDLTSYSNSIQSLSKLGDLKFINSLYTVVITISLLLYTILFVIKRKTVGNLKPISLLIIIVILINAWDCGTFANAIDRLGCKIIWLIPLITAVLFFKKKSEKIELE